MKCSSSLAHLGSLLAFLATLFPTLPALAQTPQQISLEEVIQQAKSAGPGVAAARSRVQAAHAAHQQALSYRWPEVRLEESWIRTDSPAEVFGLLLNQERFSFPTFISGNPNQPEALNTSLTRLEVKWPLWTGGEIAARIDQAGHLLSAAQALAQHHGNEVAYEAALAWLDLKEAQESLGALEAAVRSVGAHAERVARLLEQGMALRADLLASEVQVAEVRDRLSQTQRQAHLAEARLAFLLGTGPETAWVLSELPDPPQIPGPLETWLPQITGRADFRARLRELDAARLAVQIEKNRRLPRIGLFVQYNLYDERLFGTRGDSKTVALQAALPLFDGGRRRASVAEAAAKVAAGEAELRSFEDRLYLQAKMAWAQTQDAFSRWQTARVAILQAEEARRLVVERFEAGLETNSRVLEALATEQEIRLRAVRARIETWRARFGFFSALGVEPELAASLAFTNELAKRIQMEAEK